jgi:hypothetical protein
MSEFQKRYSRTITVGDRKVIQFPGRYADPRVSKRVEIPREIRIGTGIRPTDEELMQLLGAYRVGKSELGYVVIQDLVDLTGMEKGKVHQIIIYLVRQKIAVLNVNRWGRAVYVKLIKKGG